MRVALILILAVAPLYGQPLKLSASFERLAAKAVESVDVTLDSRLLGLAARFLSSEKPDEAKAKKIVTGLHGIYVRSFTFEKEGEYSDADLEPIRNQLRGPQWSRIVGIINRRERDNAEIFTRMEGDRVSGVVIVASEPKELTVVLIDGPVDLDQLSELGGHFGIPSRVVEGTKPKKDKEKEKDE